MTCSNCVAKVKRALLKLGDVSVAEIQLEAPQATISMQRHIRLEDLQAAISKAGNYQISERKVSNKESISNQLVAEKEKKSYFPVFLIFGYISIITIIVQVLKGSFNWLQWMTHFMAGFFFIFSFFKFLNLKGFAEGYRRYDIVARYFPGWGYIYPFLELGFAVLLLSGFYPILANILVFVVMAVSSVGVLQSLLRKTSFQCACLGTVIQLPLSKVTFIEDGLMMAMSLGMVIAML